MNRRALLSVVASSTLIGAGCLGTSETEARVASISLRNDREEEYDVDVAVEENGETVFSDSYTLGAEPETANQLIEDPVQGSGDYLVRVTMDGREMEVETVDFVDGDETCVAVTFTLLNNGSTDWDTKSMQEC